jgi:hypothetical protein
MLFLEDLHSTKSDKTSTEPKAPQRLPPLPPKETQYIGEPHLVLPERHERITAKRTSIFSRRRSTAVNFSPETIARTSFVTARRSSSAEMTVTESEGLKHKFHFGFSQSKKQPLKSNEDSNKGRDRQGELLCLEFDILLIPSRQRIPFLNIISIWISASC